METPAAGGAGEQWISALTLGIAALTFFLDAPKKASEAYTAILQFLRVLRRQKQLDWTVGIEVCVLLCVKELRRRVRSPIIAREGVRLVEDGTETDMWSDLPTGVHIIILPELRTRRTFVFAVDSSPRILGTLEIDRLTTDAECSTAPLDPPAASRRRRRRKRK